MALDSPQPPAKTTAAELTADILIQNYTAGYFAYPIPGTPEIISWISPDPRAVIPLSSLHLPKNVVTEVKKQSFRITIDSAFEDVIRCCADREETWITADIIQIFCELHARKIAHSFEAWDGSELVGGVYGLALGAAWLSESTFFRKKHAAKVAKAASLQCVKKAGAVLSDSQLMSNFSAQFAAVEIPRAAYLEQLTAAIRLDLRLPEPGSEIQIALG